ncbi:YetF domain-containing protein [Loktanella sp. SALINAS62]|uniref:DUF421 domain-containing protein n=1 Tax=Loktanella sp. SALINAS62 TaxID=2706124 RepID=UPI001B8CA70E|nr:YetF domain-containing protein [Loktanella sp. SALINAS62]MBS1303901.1 DUF421 domain-containing protein [Loktanella sp. SALINAS62]
MLSEMLFQNWTGLARTLIVGCLAYPALVLMLRLSGKRTLAKLNAFDLVVTVALGSTLATILLSESVALAEGVLALATLIGLQWVVAFSSVRSTTVANLVRSDAALLVREGEICHDALRRERITKTELLTVIRQSAASALDNTSAVILETDGSFSVIARAQDGDPGAYAQAGLQRQGL